MRKWLIPMILCVTIGCARSTAKAQPAEPPAEPEPAQPEARDAAQDAERDAAREERERQREEREAMRTRVRELADAERARADVLRAQVQAQVEGEMARAGVKREKSAWLGVSTNRMPAALRRHLKMKHRGIGLVVERVEPDSPAAKAGLQQYDILEKLDDQWLVNTEQFSVIIRMHQPGEDVTLSVIREGQPQQLKATLAEKELPVMDQMGLLGGVNAFGFGDADGQFNIDLGNGVAAFGGRGNVTWQLPEFNVEPMHFDFDLPNMNFGKRVFHDGEHTLKITTKDGQRHLKASDADGVVIFDGPIATEEQLETVPEEVRAKLEKYGDDGVVSLRRPRSQPTTNPGEK